MSDEVTRSNGGNVPVAPQSKNYFETYAEAMTQTTFKGRLLRLNKMGKYKAGQENEEVALGTKMIVAMNLLKTGWVRWYENKPQENRMGLLSEGYTPPPRQALGDLEEDMWEVDDSGNPRDPWQFTNYLPMMDAETGDLYTLTTAAKGGLSAIGKLSGIYGRNIRIAPNKLPVVAIDYETYMHPNKQYGEIAKPKLVPVIGWTDEIPEELMSWDAEETTQVEDHSQGAPVQIPQQQPQPWQAPQQERQAAPTPPPAAARPVAPAAAPPSRPAPKVAPKHQPAAKGRKKVSFR